MIFTKAIWGPCLKGLKHVHGSVIARGWDWQVVDRDYPLCTDETKAEVQNTQKKNAWTTKSIFFTMVAEIRQPEVRPHKSVGGAQLQKSWYLICSSGARSTINWSWVDHFIRMKIKSNKILHVIDLSMGPSLVERKFAFPFTLMKDINVE